jgi:hypothetical protein
MYLHSACAFLGLSVHGSVDHRTDRDRGRFVPQIIYSTILPASSSRRPIFAMQVLRIGPNKEVSVFAPISRQDE